VRAGKLGVCAPRRTLPLSAVRDGKLGVCAPRRTLPLSAVRDGKLGVCAPRTHLAAVARAYRQARCLRADTNFSAVGVHFNRLFFLHCCLQANGATSALGIRVRGKYRAEI
jgi:hypothetical protein